MQRQIGGGGEDECIGGWRVRKEKEGEGRALPGTASLIGGNEFNFEEKHRPSKGTIKH